MSDKFSIIRVEEIIMSDKFSIEVNTEFVENFFKLADLQLPENIELKDLNNVLDKIKNKLDTAASLKNLSGNQPKVSFNTASIPNENAVPVQIANESNLRTVLIVDDLGIVTIQLASLFKKLGFTVQTSRELFDAIKQYKTQDFRYAVIDLFIPTEREGFILLDEIKKLSLLCKLNTKIIVMSASNKQEHKEKCMHKGADLFVEKSAGWQSKITEFCFGND